MQKTYKGFELFNDIDDAALKAQNRSAVLSNIYEDNVVDGKITPKGATILLGYFSAIPEAERPPVYESFIIEMGKRGFEISNV